MNLTVSLPDELASYIKRKIDSGGDREIERLRNAWHEGILSGDFAPLDKDALKAEGRRQLAGSKA